MGKGDMLYLDPESAGLKRAQSVLVDDREIEAMINYWQSQEIAVGDRFNIPPWESMVDAQSTSGDGLLEEAIELVKKDGYASTSRLQRKLRIGFPRAARLMDELEDIGIVGPQESGGRVRDVLVDDTESTNENELI